MNVPFDPELWTRKVAIHGPTPGRHVKGSVVSAAAWISSKEASENIRMDVWMRSCESDLRGNGCRVFTEVAVVVVVVG